MTWNIDGIVDALKQSQAVVAALMPFLTEQWRLIPFMNPQIASDMWLPTSICGFVVCCTIYNLARSTHKVSFVSKVAMFSGVGVGLSFLGLLAIVTMEPFETMPRFEDYLARFMFFAIFVALAPPLGWLARTLFAR